MINGEKKFHIRAVYDDKTIRIYQAYNNRIADEAIKNGTFGSSFNRNRMTWIKPSFLWMMYRSGWATKENQERILAIKLQQLCIPEIEEDREIILLFTCKWNYEHGLGVKIVNEKIVKVGIQEEVLI